MDPIPPDYRIRIDATHGFVLVDPHDRSVIDHYRVRSDGERIVQALKKAWLLGFEAGKAEK